MDGDRNRQCDTGRNLGFGGLDRRLRVQANRNRVASWFVGVEHDCVLHALAGRTVGRSASSGRFDLGRVVLELFGVSKNRAEKSSDLRDAKR